MAPRKTSTSKAKRPKASLETKKPATGKASPLCKKARPSRGSRKPDPLQTTSTSKAIILASSVPTQPQASQKAFASTSRKALLLPKLAPVQLMLMKAVWLPLNHPKPKALNMGDLLPIPRAWGAFIIASILPVLHDTTLLLDRAKLLFAIMRRMDIDVRVVISKEMENIMKKQPDAPSTSRPLIPRHQTQAEINQMILDNQAALAHRQEVLYDSLRRGQLILVKNLVDILGRVHTEAQFFLHSGDLKDDALGENLGH
ncbi:Lipopolysaccharide core biosynthesis mannosyltransferase lpsB [Sesbania bispinosa]|nr:Lipopolysaccharide core biosynthesis mannosyltransferase lpsB [Sesbania bispinosa]